MTKMKIGTGDWIVVCDGRKALILENIGDRMFPNLHTKEVHEHPDPLVRKTEQVVGLDDFQPLVHQRGGVNGDLAAHLPGRVRERLLAGHRVQGGAAAEGAAAGREHEPVHAAGALASDQLVERRVLGVHRDDLVSPLLGAHHQGATDNQRLLVRQRQRCLLYTSPSPRD